MKVEHLVGWSEHLSTAKRARNRVALEETPQREGVELPKQVSSPPSSESSTKKKCGQKEGGKSDRNTKKEESDRVDQPRTIKEPAGDNGSDELEGIDSDSRSPESTFVGVAASVDLPIRTKEYSTDRPNYAKSAPGSVAKVPHSYQDRGTSFDLSSRNEHIDEFTSSEDSFILSHLGSREVEQYSRLPTLSPIQVNQIPHGIREKTKNTMTGEGIRVTAFNGQGDVRQFVKKVRLAFMASAAGLYDDPRDREDAQVM